MVKKQEIRVHVIHGPNLNMLGKREPEIYGGKSLDDINTDLKGKALTLGIELETFQSNHESEIVEKIHAIFNQGSNGIIINPAAFTHTSIAIRDALLLVDIPIIEVHLSNIYKREEFRHKSMLSDIVTGQITGLGSIGYTLALNAIVETMHGK
jgi:3-dehydroquinate dehydratase-2